MKSKRAMLEKIIKLAEARNSEEERLKKKYKIYYIDFFNPKQNELEWDKAPRPKGAEFKEYLASLNEGDIIYVATVMYGGRDYLTYGEEEDFEGLYNYLKPRVKGLIYSVMEKVPLPDYLRAGIKVFKIK